MLVATNLPMIQIDKRLSNFSGKEKVIELNKKFKNSFLFTYKDLIMQYCLFSKHIKTIVMQCQTITQGQFKNHARYTNTLKAYQTHCRKDKTARPKDTVQLLSLELIIQDQERDLLGRKYNRKWIWSLRLQVRGLVWISGSPNQVPNSECWDPQFGPELEVMGLRSWTWGPSHLCQQNITYQ